MLFTLTHFLSHPGSRAHLGLAEGRGEAEVGTGWQKSCVKTRETLPFLQGGCCSAGPCVSSSHHWVQQGPHFQVQAAVFVPSSCLCPAPVCACLRSAFGQGGGVCLVSEGPCKRHQLQGSLELSLGVFVKYSTMQCHSREWSSAWGGSVVGEQSRIPKQWQTCRCLYGSDTWETGGISKVERTIFLCCREDWALFWRDEKECDKGVVKRCSLLLKIRRGIWGIMRLYSNL